MPRLLTLLGVLVICGCTPSGADTCQRPSDQNDRPTALPVSAFSLDQARQVISLDTRVAPPQRRRFDIGQGSVTLETIRVANNRLTFQYTPDVEGGYRIYECTVPVSRTTVEIKIAPDGTPGATSFDLTTCKLIRAGNVHDE